MILKNDCCWGRTRVIDDYFDVILACTYHGFEQIFVKIERCRHLSGPYYKIEEITLYECLLGASIILYFRLYAVFGVLKYYREYMSFAAVHERSKNPPQQNRAVSKLRASLSSINIRNDSMVPKWQRNPLKDLPESQK